MSLAITTVTPQGVTMAADELVTVTRAMADPDAVTDIMAAELQGQAAVAALRGTPSAMTRNWA